jgi:hypothetical protein
MAYTLGEACDRLFQRSSVCAKSPCIIMPKKDDDTSSKLRFGTRRFHISHQKATPENIAFFKGVYSTLGYGTSILGLSRIKRNGSYLMTMRCAKRAPLASKESKYIPGSNRDASKKYFDSP